MSTEVTEKSLHWNVDYHDTYNCVEPPLHHEIADTLLCIKNAIPSYMVSLQIIMGCKLSQAEHSRKLCILRKFGTGVTNTLGYFCTGIPKSRGVRFPMTPEPSPEAV